jgi:hypothetical protein
MLVLLRAVVALSLLGAAAIHAAQTPSHVEQWWAAGIVFVTLAVAQAALGVAALAVTDRGLYAAAIVVSVATIALWVGSRTIGLPIGPEVSQPEPVGRADLTATLLEVATVLAAVALARAGGAPAWRRSGRAGMLAVAVVAALTAVVSWYGLQPTSVCDTHHANPTPFGPLTPLEGHSLLPAATPIAAAPVGDRVGLVVGLLRNCATGPIAIYAAKVLAAAGDGHTATTGRFFITGAPPAQPGAIVAGQQLAGVQPLPGAVTVQPTPNSPSRALVLELQTVRVGGFRVDAVTISYRSGGRSYTAAFATNAQLIIGQHHYQVVRPGRTEASTHASLAAHHAHA